MFLGSFNPIHTGHLIIAQFFAQHTDLDQVCFVVSPQSPLKADQDMLPDDIRLELVRMATEDNPLFTVSDIEMGMERPSYTINTLKKIQEENPASDFVLLLGSDNLEVFHQWKDYEEILNMIDVYVYPRPGHVAGRLIAAERVSFYKAPLLDISSSFIRMAINKGKDPRYYLPEPVYHEVINKGYYRDQELPI